MKFADIPARMLSFRVKSVDGPTGSPPEGPVLSVAPCSSRPGEFEVRLKDSLILVKPVSDADTRRLTTELAGGCAILAQFFNPAADGSVELHVAFFAGECVEIGAVEIGADEYVERTISAIARQRLSGKILYDALAERCCYNHGGQPFFFFFAGPAIDSALQTDQENTTDDSPEKGEKEDEIESSDPENMDDVGKSFTCRSEPTRKNSLCIVGNGVRFVATETPRPDGKSVFVATRLTRNRAEFDRALRIARGNLSFLDWTRAGQIQILTKAQLSELSKNDDSYLKRWDEFVDIEGELLLERAREIGALQYSGMTPCRDGTVAVRITKPSDSALKALADGDVESVELTDELPEYLRNPDLKFSQFTGAIEKEAFSGGRKSRKKDARQYYDVADYDADESVLTLKTENLPASGTLILSLAGQVAQIKRRLFARKAILEGRAANPQLGLLIEEKGVIAPTRAPSRIKPLTAFVVEKVFRNPPTERQRDAIEIALNTPDLALIQGPPGTGKTTVIAAIIERLNETADRRGAGAKGAVLLTGLQHDAVENMIERLSLNGLPVPKFGSRSGQKEDDFSMFERKLQDWCYEKASALRSRNPQLAKIEQETQIRNLCIQYLKAPTRALALEIVKNILDLDVFIVGEECSRRAAHLAATLSLEEKLYAESDPLLETVRRLRRRPESFADDGPERAADALDDLYDVLEEDARVLLEKASLWRNEEGIPPFLNDIAALKKILLSRFAAPPVFRVEKQNDEIIALVKEATKRIRTAGISAKDAKSNALAEFLAELEGNPYGMMDAVSDYAYAFAATCQQSVNRQMQKQKGIDEDNSASEFQRLEYDYVIVDEAARVSPPDLMVAMAQGKRIILVGDHRQLPHIIDEAVAKQMETGQAGKLESEWIKKSMFEYLFSERLKVLEQKDGIPRRVTLDKQHRMHPLLGDFVSRNFYERFDPSEKFASGRPESDFAHSLPDTGGAPVIWLDVPAAKGRHGKDGTSWIRRAEASAIADLLRTWMNSREGQNLSFGVISFYRAQSELIKRQLSTLTDDHRKLRIGTVDSFQGMEFDVVILSMVRTMPDNWKPRSDDEEIQARGLFGHLCLYNRLNVSMSRQKKLLVVAGDSELLRSDLAARYIPGLVDFLKLCKVHGKVLLCR